MAIEIPSLQADRVVRPQWGAGAPLERFQLPADRLLAALQNLPVPNSLLSALRNLAQTGTAVDLLVAGDRGLLQILVDGRRTLLAGAARDAVLALLGQGTTTSAQGGGPAAGIPSAGLLDASTAARAASVDAQVQESRLLAVAPGTQSVEGEPESPATVIGTPLLQAPAPGDAAKSLAHAVESSGLFLEAHVAQMLRGERSLRQIEEEARRLPVDAQTGPMQMSDRRSALQMDAMQRQALTLVGQAWAGQPIRISIEADRQRKRDGANPGETTGVFVATLSIRLPNLGPLQARIRVMERTVGVWIESDRSAALTGELPSLAEALSAHGLTLAQLAAAMPAAQDP